MNSDGNVLFKLIQNPPQLPLLAIPFHAVLPPLIHHFLLSQCHVPPLMATIPIALFLASFPLLVHHPELIVNATLVLCSAFYTLRILDIGYSFTSTQLSFWSIRDYYEYMLTLENHFTRKWEKETASKTKGKQTSSSQEWKSRRVLPEQRTLGYYTRVLGTLLFEVIGIQLCSKYVLENPIVHKLKPLDYFWFDDWHVGANLMAQWFVIYLGVDMGYTLLLHIVCEVYAVPYIPSFNYPLLSKSLRDYWTFRWNVITKEALQRVGLRPMFSFLGKISAARPGKRPVWQYFLGAISTFVVSALMHEWIVLCIVAEPTYGDQALFFMTHGLLTITEVLIVKAIGKNVTHKVPSVFGMVWTYGVFLWTAPLFLGPMNRAGMWDQMRDLTLI